MKIPTLCDNCKREFMCEEDVVDGLGQVICPDCKADLEI